MFRALKRLTPRAVGELLKSDDAKLEEWARKLAAVFLWVAGDEGEVTVNAGRVWHAEPASLVGPPEPAAGRPGAPDGGDSLGEVDPRGLLGDGLYEEIRSLGSEEDDPRLETEVPGPVAAERAVG